MIPKTKKALMGDVSMGVGRTRRIRKRGVNLRTKKYTTGTRRTLHHINKTKIQRGGDPPNIGELLKNKPDGMNDGEFFRYFDKLFIEKCRDKKEYEILTNGNQVLCEQFGLYMAQKVSMFKGLWSINTFISGDTSDQTPTKLTPKLSPTDINKISQHIEDNTCDGKKAINQTVMEKKQIIIDILHNVYNQDSIIKLLNKTDLIKQIFDSPMQETKNVNQDPELMQSEESGSQHEISESPMSESGSVTTQQDPPYSNDEEIQKITSFASELIKDIIKTYYFSDDNDINKCEMSKKIITLFKILNAITKTKINNESAFQRASYLSELEKYVCIKLFFYIINYGILMGLIQKPNISTSQDVSAQKSNQVGGKNNAEFWIMFLQVVFALVYLPLNFALFEIEETLTRKINKKIYGTEFRTIHNKPTLKSVLADLGLFLGKITVFVPTGLIIGLLYSPFYIKKTIGSYLSNEKK